jgi:hypothetical protein
MVVSETSLCSDANASVAVVAPGATPAPTAPAPTAPPTSTGVTPASNNNDGTIWFLPFALVGFFGSLLVILDQRRRRGI